ncbi:aromatic alcohol reductase [Aspergillus puulaauensis]|uniref:NmrA-like domain-containing protein n=1 Tax=Aspergillus puulaauensis TaxID=1220207 RepID=A0A7R8ATZ0_9EURO|nr:uncharacterized protein APUU_80975A [Aspergillus puulaauensis]BCS30672.1 hypothetical protein APUU_80975A [Aspergillus puulaauensis]
MSSVKVAVAGGSGAVGIPVIKELLAAGFLVTVLRRIGSDSSSNLPESSGLSIREVDYESIASLTGALQGHTVVVACFGVSAPIGSQDVLIDASIAAGVTRFFPAEFGTDTQNEKCIRLPVFANKIHTLNYLKEKAATNPSFTYTAVCPGFFIDWGLEGGFLVNPKAHSATVYDDGERLFSVTTLKTTAKAVVGIINRLEETKNRHVYIQDALVSQIKLIAIAKKLDGRDWDITPIKSSSAEFDAYAELKKENPDAQKSLFPLLNLSILGEGYGGDFSAHLDNKLLGIEGFSDNELEHLVRKYL